MILLVDWGVAWLFSNTENSAGSFQDNCEDTVGRCLCFNLIHFVAFFLQSPSKSLSSTIHVSSYKSLPCLHYCHTCRYYFWGPFFQTFPCCTDISWQISCLMGGKKNIHLFLTKRKWWHRDCVTYLKLSAGARSGICTQDEEAVLQSWGRSGVLSLWPCCSSISPASSATAAINLSISTCLPLNCSCGVPFWNKRFCEGSTLIKNAIFSLWSPDNIWRLL